MRHLLAILALLAVALAGCTKPDEPPAAATPSTTPPAATPAPTPQPSPTPTPTTPAPREAKTVYNGSHDFTGPPPPPNAPPKTENFSVEAGHATLRVRIAFTSAGPAGDISLSAGAVVRVVDPAGAVVVECSGKDDADCDQDLAAPAAGAWKVEYAGSGTGKATVTITQIP